MRSLFAALLLIAAPAMATEVPSGQPVDLQEVLIDDVGGQNWLRFRFIAPQIERGGDYEAIANDMLHLCQSLALSYISDFELIGEVIVISLADRATEFGVATPDAVQFFEAFRPQDDTCIWEGQ